MIRLQGPKTPTLLQNSVALTTSFLPDRMGQGSPSIGVDEQEPRQRIKAGISVELELTAMFRAAWYLDCGEDCKAKVFQNLRPWSGTGDSVSQGSKSDWSHMNRGVMQNLKIYSEARVGAC